ncbi:MAG TPA: proline dehydrogenase family protein [Chitinophagaceae bacterium]|nr:proline dehydrogenase family protein [Chitinophagaceae bacterium]
MDPHLSLSFDNTEIAFARKSDLELKREERLFTMMNNKGLVFLGSTLAQIALKLHLPVRGIIKRTVFEQFCGGENLEGAGETSKLLDKSGIRVILDYGVESKLGEINYDHNHQEFIRVIRFASQHPNIPFISLKVTGFARFQLLEKRHAGIPLTPEEEQEFARVRERILDICQFAARSGIGVHIDAEESWIQQPVDELTVEMMERFNQEKVVVYNTFQLYLKDRLDYLKHYLADSEKQGYLPGIKLVRGAYLEKERKRAVDKHYPSPVQMDKLSTDRDYDEALIYCLERLGRLSLFVATHNEKSCLLASTWMTNRQIRTDHPQVYFSQLYGMSDHISYNLANAGFRVSKYLPFGPLEEVMPYLIRRAEENTAIRGQISRELGLIRSERRRRKK